MKSFDVLVCGAGSAGFIAAVAAARMGVRVAIIERYNCPGGILTVLGNNSIDQFNNPFIEKNKMVISGIAWEYVRRLHADGFARIPDMNAEYRTHDQYGVKVNPVAAAKLMDDMLIESGVHIYYGQPLVSAVTEGRRIKSLLIATKSGLRELWAEIIIDCTGDGEAAALAGAGFATGDKSGCLQPGTIRYYPATDADDRILNYGGNRNHVKLNITDSDSVTAAEIESRRMLYEQMRRGERIMASAPAVAPREGRRICGLCEMNSDDYCSGRIFEDSVCYSYWFVDIHRDNEPTYIRYIKHSNTPTIRLSAMISCDIENLLMAGRCVSSDRETNSAIRVKASCMAMGEAAGTAAALAIKLGVEPGSLPADKVRNTLADNGTIVPGLTETAAFGDIL